MPQRSKNAPPPTVDSALRIMWITWAAFLMTQGVFFAVTQVSPVKTTREADPMVSWALLGIAVMLIVSSYVIRARLVAQAVAKQNLQNLVAAGVAAFALCEGASIFGILVHFGFNSPYYAIFFALSAVGILGHFPRRAQLEAATPPKPIL